MGIKDIISKDTRNWWENGRTRWELAVLVGKCQKMVGKWWENGGKWREMEGKRRENGVKWRKLYFTIVPCRGSKF